MRVRITLECTECKERNYTTTKNRRTHPGRAKRRKHCPRCNRHSEHKETR